MHGYGLPSKKIASPSICQLPVDLQLRWACELLSHAWGLKFLILCECVCCVWGYVHGRAGAFRDHKRALGYFGDGVLGNSDLSDVGAGNPTEVLCKNTEHS